MKTKIATYVNHYFRFDKREDLDELKEEIISNLNDRYDQLISEGRNEQDAYIEAVKSMGDFHAKAYDEDSIEYKELPSVPEYLLIASAILAVFGAIFVLLNTLTGGIATAMSIIFYACGGYFLYAKAMHVKANELDIELHNSYLKNIFKYMKTSFGFWSFSISVLVAMLVQSISNLIVFAMQADVSPNLSDIQDMIQNFVFFSIFAFIISFIVLIILSKNIYDRLMMKYYILTGHTDLKGKIRESFDYIDDIQLPKSKDIRITLSYVFGLSLIALFFITGSTLEINRSGIFVERIEGAKLYTFIRLFDYYPVISITVFVGLGWIILSYFYVLKFKKSAHLLFQSYLVFGILLTVSTRLMDQNNVFHHFGITPIFILIPFALSFIYYLYYGITWLLQRKHK